ncbi:MAG: peptidase dimerization domain-containing protein [Gemmatimonadota bacterium]|nr:peptidase dimerization domain-containing protein [Gemmatimonadota bacterium]
MSNDVQASEKRVANFRLEVTNEVGHSSTPIRDNAITRLAEALAKLGAHDFPVRLNPVTTAYFARSAELVGGPMGPRCRRSWRTRATRRRRTCRRRCTGWSATRR